jgi:hypothetical protein
LKVAELKLALRSLGESTSQNKPQLVERLRAKLLGYNAERDNVGIASVKAAVDAALTGASPARAEPYPTAPTRNIPKGPPVPPLVPMGIVPMQFSPFHVAPQAQMPSPMSGFGTKSLVDNVKFKWNPFYEPIRKVIQPRVTEGTLKKETNKASSTTIQRFPRLYH